MEINLGLITELFLEYVKKYGSSHISWQFLSFKMSPKSLDLHINIQVPKQ